MNATHPESFAPNWEYRTLSVAEGKGKYRFRTLKPVQFPVTGSVARPISFRDHTGKEWMRITSRFITIAADYAWNGNSPKSGFVIGGRDVWFGTPDFKPTIPASLLHDALFQFSAVELFPFSLTDCNNAYYDICRAKNFKLSAQYIAALNLFSKNFFGKDRGDKLYAVEL